MTRPSRNGCGGGPLQGQGRVCRGLGALALYTPHPGTWPAGLFWPRPCTQLSSLQGGDSASMVPPPPASRTTGPSCEDPPTQPRCPCLSRSCPADPSLADVETLAALSPRAACSANRGLLL